MNLSKCPTVLFTRIGLSWLSFFNHITVPQLPEILFHPPTHSLSFTYELMIETKLFAQLILLSIYSVLVLYKYGRHPRPINQRKRKNHPKNVFEINEPFNDDGDPIPRNFHPFWHLTKLLLCWGWFSHLRLLHLTDHLHELIIEPDSFMLLTAASFL